MSKDKKFIEQLKELQDVALFNANLTTQLGDEVKELKEDMSILRKRTESFLNPDTAISIASAE